MGLFDFIGSATKQLGSDIAGGLNLLSAIGSHPITTVGSIGSFVINPNSQNAQSVLDNVQKTKSEGALKTSVNTVVNTATAAAAIATGYSLVGGAGAVAKVGSVIAAHPLASTATVLATPVVTNVLTSSKNARVTVAKAIVNTPSALQNYGSNIGTAIENPSLSSITNIAKENPILTGLTAAGIAYAAGGLVSTAVTALNTHSVEQNTAAMAQSTPSAALPQQIYTTQVLPVQSPAENVAAPVVAAVSKQAGSQKKNKAKKKVVKKKTTKKKKKALKKKNTNKKRATSKKKKKKR